MKGPTLETVIGAMVVPPVAEAGGMNAFAVHVADDGRGYRVAIMEDDKKTWLPWMRGMVDEGGSNDSFAGEPGCGIVDVELDMAMLGPNGWFEKNMRDGKLIGLTVYYDTADPESTGWWYCKYRVHWLGRHPGWGKWEHDDEDGGAGNDSDQIDMIELSLSSN